jgi:2'-5' RNA ligase
VAERRREELQPGHALSFFVAVDLDAPVRAEVTSLIEARSKTTEAKWLPPRKLHITLQYLGHPKPDAVAALEPKLAALARGRARFSLALHGAGTFETRRAPAVLWLGVGGELEPLRTLQRDVAHACGAVDDKPFVPHLTLARGQSAKAMAAVAKELEHFRTQSFVVSGLTLYESKDDVFRVASAAEFS